VVGVLSVLFNFALKKNPLGKVKGIHKGLKLNVTS